MKLGSLFSGGGLGDFGFMAAGMEIAWQCEIDEYCQKILELRYPESKKYRDIKTLKGEELERVDIITGGFPCQPASVAGKQRGTEDDRWLWGETIRIVSKIKPTWCVFENVFGLVNLQNGMALESILLDLEAEGYEVWPIVFPSHALGAWHKRDRLWIICHTKHDGQFTSKECKSYAQRNDNISTRTKETWEFKGSNWSRTYWLSEPRVDRMVDGCPDRVHRLKMLGNGQTPCSTYVIGKMIMEIEK